MSKDNKNLNVIGKETKVNSSNNQVKQNHIVYSRPVVFDKAPDPNKCRLSWDW